MLRSNPIVKMICGATLVLAAAGMLALMQPQAAPQPVLADSGPEIMPPPEIAPEDPMPANPEIEQLINGVLDARKRQDRDWLARSLYSVPRQSQLEEVHLLRAYRYFLWGSVEPFWQRIENAWQSKAYQITQQGSEAEIAFEVGGALGRITLRFVKVDQSWYFADM